MMKSIIYAGYIDLNSDMILVSTMGLCRASTSAPLNEQGMAMKGERIRIALEECFTSINHSFDGCTLGESFEVLP